MSQPAFDGIVGEADAPVFKEQGERRPTLEYVIDGLGEVLPPCELSELQAHIGLEILVQGRAQLAARRQAFLCAQAIDGSLDLEQGADAAHDLDRDRRHRDFLFAGSLATLVFLKIGHGEGGTPCTHLARRLLDSRRHQVLAIACSKLNRSLKAAL